MNKILILLGFIALACANECFFNTTQVASICVGVNSNCNWTNTDLWSNCNNGYPGNSDTGIIFSENTTFTLTISSSVNVSGITIMGTGNSASISVQAPIMVGEININAGSLSIDAAVTMSGGANSNINVDGATSWASGDITWAGGSTGAIIVGGNSQFAILAGTHNINQNIVVNQEGTLLFSTTSALTLEDGSSIISNGTINFAGVSTITGTNNSRILSNSVGSVVFPAGTVNQVTFDLPVTFNSFVYVQNATVTVNSAFYAQNLTIDESSTINVDLDGNGNFNVLNFLNYGTVNWANGDNFVVPSQEGSFINKGNMIFTSAESSITCIGSTIENWETMTVSGNITIHGDFINKGTVTINGFAFFVGNQSSAGTTTFEGQSFGGTGSATFKGDFYFLAGSFDLVSTITGTLTIAQNYTKVLGTNVNVQHMNVSTTVQLSESFTVGELDYVYGDNAVFEPVGNNTETTFTNQGKIDGTITFDRINLINEATIGFMNVATSINMEDAFLTLANTSQLNVGLSSTATPLSITKTNRNLGGNPGALLGGALHVVLLDGFNPTNGNMTLLKITGNPVPVNGTFSSFNVTEFENANSYNCEYNTSAINYSPSTGEIFLSFQNCADLPDTTSSSGPSKTTIIIIVVVVVAVVVIAAIVGVVLYRRRNAAHHPSEKQRLI